MLHHLHRAVGPVLRHAVAGPNAVRSFAGASREYQESPSLYAVLDVPQSATAEDIRQAFLAKAKQLHPDAQPTPAPQGHARHTQGGGQPLDGDRFLLLMSAYEVLRSPERRHHYHEMLKLRRSQGSDSAAVVSGFPGPDMGFAATGAEPDAEWQRSSVDAADAEAERWLRWLYEFIGGVDAPQSALVRRYHGAALRSALIEAYLGPWVEVEQGFPPCFECEERNAGLTGIHEIMHIVSGRQLLGLVRFQQQAQLGTSQPDTTGALHSGSGPPCQLPRSLGEPHTGNRTIVSELPPSSRAAQPKPSAPRSTPPHTNADSPLEVTLGGRVVARAVRTPAGVSAAVAEAVHGTAGFPAVARCPSDGSLLQDVISIFVQPEHSGADGAAPPGMRLTARVVGLRDMGRSQPLFDDDTPVVVSALGRKLRHAMVCNAQGMVSHTVVAYRTLGVRSLLWTQGILGWVEARCRRAWLPPSEWWMFHPRVDTHNTGGWYIERYTEDSPYTPRHTTQPRQRPSGVLPAPVHILVSAYESLDEERAKGSAEADDNWKDQAQNAGAALWRGWANTWRRALRRTVSPAPSGSSCGSRNT